jgi:hypothetical protein
MYCSLNIATDPIVPGAVTYLILKKAAGGAMMILFLYFYTGRH